MAITISKDNGNRTVSISFYIIIRSCRNHWSRKRCASCYLHNAHWHCPSRCAIVENHSMQLPWCGLRLVVNHNENHKHASLLQIRPNPNYIIWMYAPQHPPHAPSAGRQRSRNVWWMDILSSVCCAFRVRRAHIMIKSLSVLVDVVVSCVRGGWCLMTEMQHRNMSASASNARLTSLQHPAPSNARRVMQWKTKCINHTCSTAPPHVHPESHKWDRTKTKPKNIKNIKWPNKSNNKFMNGMTA